MEVLYEDNHLIAVNKSCSEIVQSDPSGDVPLDETVKAWIKEKHHKPGNVFLGVTHRIDRPVSGVVLFAKTSKSLARLNLMFRNGEVHKTYLAIVQQCPPLQEDWLDQYLVRNTSQNKSYVCSPNVPGAKRAILHYKVVARSDRYTLLEVDLKTGRHHQIRCQLASMGCPIKGDLKYGAPRSNPDGGIGLHARRVRLVHPVSHTELDIVAPFPAGEILWEVFSREAEL